MSSVEMARSLASVQRMGCGGWTETHRLLDCSTISHNETPPQRTIELQQQFRIYYQTRMFQKSTERKQPKVQTYQAKCSSKPASKPANNANMERCPGSNRSDSVRRHVRFDISSHNNDSSSSSSINSLTNELFRLDMKDATTHHQKVPIEDDDDDDVSLQFEDLLFADDTAIANANNDPFATFHQSRRGGSGLRTMQELAVLQQEQQQQQQRTTTTGTTTATNTAPNDTIAQWSIDDDDKIVLLPTTKVSLFSASDSRKHNRSSSSSNHTFNAAAAADFLDETDTTQDESFHPDDLF